MSDLFTLVLATVKEATEKANSVASKITAATTDRTKHIHELRTEVETDDATILAFREWFEKANAAIEAKTNEIDEYISKSIPSVSEDDVNALKEEYKSAKTQVTTALAFAKNVPGWDDSLMADIPELRTIRGGSSSGGGTGAKRPRLERLSYSVDNGKTYTEVYTKAKDKEGNDVEKTNFTLAAKTLGSLVEPAVKVEVKDLQAAAFDAAKTDDLATLGGKVFEFVYSVGTGDKAKNVFVRVQPRGDVVTEEESAEEESTEESTDSE